MVDAGLHPDPWQVELLQSNHRQTLICASRQCGKSSATAFLALKTALLEPGSTVVVVGPVEEQANELLRKVLKGIDALDRPVAVTREAVTRLELANGSRVIALPGKERRVRGYTATLLIIDEAARVPNDVFNGASPTMAVSRGRFVALSTAFAKSGWFYEEWIGQDSYQRLSVRAHDCPRIPKEFLERERKRMGDRWYEMEYMNSFASDVASVFNADDIRRAVSSEVMPLFPEDAKPSITSRSPISSEVIPLFGN